MIPGRWEWVDTPRLIPVDRVAEESLAGAAIVSAADAHDIAGLVGVDEFHDPRCWQIVDAAADPRLDDLDDEGIDWTDYDSDLALLTHGCARRGAAIASETGIEISWLRQLVNHRTPLQTEHLVNRLIDVGVMRRDNRFHLDMLIGNGVDVRMLTNFDAWMGQSQAVILQACLAVGDALFRGGSDAAMADALADLAGIFAIDLADVSDALRPTGGTDE